MAAGHTVALYFEDGVTRFITCQVTETVADASFRAGINIPMDCRDGVCGTCKAHCDFGSYDGGSYLEDALSPQEELEGFALPCQMKPLSDLVLQIPASSSVCKTRAEVHHATIIRVAQLSETTMSLHVECEKPLAFLPGQYVNIQIPNQDQSRAYSFSTAAGSSFASFLIRKIPGGAMTTFLTEQAAPGMKLSLLGPHGSFYLRDIKRPVLMLAGGTGLAPFLSILETIAMKGSKYPVHLIYGVTRDEDLVELSRIESLAANLPGFTWSACVADDDSVHKSKGYVTRYLEPSHLDGGNVDVYVCGPPPMVEAVRNHFTHQGIVPVGFFFEKFAPSSTGGILG